MMLALGTHTIHGEVFHVRRTAGQVALDHPRWALMMGFGETFQSRIDRWVEQNAAQVRPEEIDGSGEDALKAQLVIEAAIESWETGRVIDVERE